MIPPARHFDCQCNFLQTFEDSAHILPETLILSLTSTAIGQTSLKKSCAVSTWPVFGQQVPRLDLVAACSNTHTQTKSCTCPFSHMSKYPGSGKQQEPWIFRNTHTAYSHSLQQNPRSPPPAHLSPQCQGHRYSYHSASTCWGPQVQRRSTSNITNSRLGKATGKELLTDYHKNSNSSWFTDIVP